MDNLIKAPKKKKTTTTTKVCLSSRNKGKSDQLFRLCIFGGHVIYILRIFEFLLSMKGYIKWQVVWMQMDASVGKCEHTS